METASSDSNGTATFKSSVLLLPTMSLISAAHLVHCHFNNVIVLHPKFRWGLFWVQFAVVVDKMDTLGVLVDSFAHFGD